MPENGKMLHRNVLGKKRKRKRSWISEESWTLIEQRNELNTKMIGLKSIRIKEQIRQEYKEKDKEIKKHIRSDKREFINNIAKQAEEAAYHQNMRTVYALTKKLSNEETHKNSPAIEDKNGNLINGRVETLERWNEHFKEILNRKDPEKPIIDAETEATVIEEINIQEPNH